MRLDLSLALCALAASITAQTYTVVPVGYALVDGGSGNNVPWNFAAGRYQQIHGDIRGVARLINEIAFRRNGATTTYSTATARTVDIELYMCNSNHWTVSTTFAANYSGTPIKVVNRKMVNLPDFRTHQGAPAPWNIAIPFDTPWMYTGTLDLLWEYVVYANTATGDYFTDYKSYTLSHSGAHILSGFGCIATGRTVPMSIAATQNSNISTNLASVGWNVSQAPANALSAILVGTANPNLALPILCERLRVDGVFLSFNATASSLGAYSSGLLQLPWNPVFAGLVTHAQGAAYDAGQPGLSVAVTNGVLTTFAALPPVQPISRVYSSGSATAASGTLGHYNGLVTRLRH